VVKIQARSVVVDVIVTRGNDEPASGLNAQDFAVFEDGKEQHLNFFEEHSGIVHQSAVAAQGKAANIYSNIPSIPESDSVTVLLLDRLNTPAQEQSNFLGKVDSFLDQMPAGARISIVTLGSKLQTVCGFTADHAQLRAAMKNAGSKIAPGSFSASRGPQDDQDDRMQVAILKEQAQMPTLAYEAGPEMAQIKDSQRAAMTLRALDQLSRTLAGLPGRKNLFWLSNSFPVAILPSDQNRQLLSQNADAASRLRETSTLLTTSRMAVYPVSLQGVVNDQFTMASDKTEAFGAQQEISDAANAERNAQAVNRAAMEHLALDTGGQVIYGTNELGKSVARALEDSKHYYTIAYTPSNERDDGKFRQIQVKLSHSKGKLTYRRGYYADLSASAGPTQGDPLAPLLVRGLPSSTQILYQVRVLPAVPQPERGAARAGGNARLPDPVTRYKLDFALTANTLTWTESANGTHNSKIEVGLIGYDRAGITLNWTGNAMELNLNGEDFAKAQRAGVPVHLMIDLPNTDVLLTSGIYDLGGHKAGTLEIPLSYTTPGK
jgi:VWFA-related protein